VLATENEIRAMVDRKTEAWNRQDAETLVSLFHPDMVWPWPPDEHSHGPASELARAIPFKLCADSAQRLKPGLEKAQILGLIHHL